MFKNRLNRDNLKEQSYTISYKLVCQLLDTKINNFFQILISVIHYILTNTWFCLYVFVPKDLADRSKNVVILYSEA